MLRALVAGVCFSSIAFAADAPDPVTRAVAVQKAVHDAKEALAAGKPAEAAKCLEGQLPNADGSKEYLDLLGRAYQAELTQQRSATTPNESRVREITTRLAALGIAVEPATPTSGSAPSPLADALTAATGFFQKADFPSAARLFEKAFHAKVELRPDQLAAWAYCRVKVAADQLNKSGNDVAAAKAVVAEVTEALALAPNHDGLQKAGGEVLAAARKRAGLPATAAPTAAPLPAGWEVVETTSFRVRHKGHKTLAETIASAAEAKRTEIYSRWSGPPHGSWFSKCDIVLHPAASDFMAATKQPAGATGLATVKLEDGAVNERRLDLRADDPNAVADALPRELTHVIVADLFPTQSPPTWAVLGMAVLACSDGEVDRHDRTATTAARTQELFTVADLIGLAGFPPADKVTGFYTSAVTLVEYLVKARGEKAFTTFLRDSQRYGIEAALKRNYDTDARKLDSAWRQNVLAGH